MRILLIEDEQPLRVAVSDSLRDEGYRVLTATDGEEGLRMALKEKPDLILLDVMLPKLAGFALCKELRRLGHTTPVLMLTAKGLVSDRVKGLDAGADDYVVKPFSLAELHARIRAIRRRFAAAAKKTARVEFGDVAVDFSKKTCRRNGRKIELTAKEFDVLELLVSRPGEAVSRDDFLDLVWGYAAFPTTRTVDNYIARLRTKLEPDPQAPVYLLTVPKVGYRFEEE